MDANEKMKAIDEFWQEQQEYLCELIISGTTGVARFDFIRAVPKFLEKLKDLEVTVTAITQYDKKSYTVFFQVQ